MSEFEKRIGTGSLPFFPHCHFSHLNLASASTPNYIEKRNSKVINVEFDLALVRVMIKVVNIS